MHYQRPYKKEYPPARSAELHPFALGRIHSGAGRDKKVLSLTSPAVLEGGEKIRRAAVPPAFSTDPTTSASSSSSSFAAAAAAAAAATVAPAAAAAPVAEGKKVAAIARHCPLSSSSSAKSSPSSEGEDAVFLLDKGSCPPPPHADDIRKKAEELSADDVTCRSGADILKEVADSQRTGANVRWWNPATVRTNKSGQQQRQQQMTLVREQGHKQQQQQQQRRRSLKFGVFAGLTTIWFTCIGLVVGQDPAEQGAQARLAACSVGAGILLLVTLGKEKFRRRAVRRAGMCLGREHCVVRAASRMLLAGSGNGKSDSKRKKVAEEKNFL